MSIRSADTMWAQMMAGEWSIVRREDGRLTFRRERRPSRPLSAREQEVAKLAAIGFGNPEIGADLDMSPSTVGVHLKSIRTKLGLDNRMELVRVLRMVSMHDGCLLNKRLLLRAA